MRHSTVSSIAALLLALAPTLILAPAASAQGLSYDISTTGTGLDPRSGGTTTRTFMTAHGQFTPGKSRLDIIQSMAPGGMMGPGTYMITDAAKSTSTSVDPAKRTYMVMDLAELAKTSAGLQQAMGGSYTIQVSGVKIDVQDLGAGETMEGYATWKYRIAESYTMTMTMMGHATTTASQSTTDLWVAPALDGLMDPSARPASTTMTEGPMAELYKPLAAAYAKVRKGLMLKRVTSSESGTEDRKHPTSMTMTISNVHRASISPGVFEVPAGYTKVASLSDALAPMGAIADSMAAHSRGDSKHGAGTTSAASEAVDSAAAGVHEAVTESAKDGAKSKTKKLLGHLFGRP